MNSSYITETIARQRLDETARSAQGYAARRLPVRPVLRPSRPTVSCASGREPGSRDVAGNLRFGRRWLSLARP